MKYKVTERLLELISDMIKEGYKGTAELVSSFPSSIGIDFKLQGCIAFQLTGFCKESLYLAADVETGEIHAFGRYSRLDKESYNDEEYNVEHIVDIAWFNYKHYKASGYTIPYEFVELFKKYEYIKKKVVTETIWEEV